MRYLPGLDGLRAVAVIAVVLFHAELSWAPGGFLGVSLFFTLSGFLITSLLLAEHERSATISLRAFYGRRARRLLPAAYLCLALVMTAWIWWSAAQQQVLPGDLVASVANVANWRFAFAPTGYEEIFLGDPSPVAHFWSLAIEEQVYLVLPVLCLAALRRGPRALTTGIGVLLAASIAATILTTDRALVYNGTHTRIAEVLVGAALAVWLHGRAAPTPTSTRWSWLPGALAGTAFITLVALAGTDQQWVYRGGLPAVAVISAVLVGSIARGRFPARLLEARPLVRIGALSYGVYLFHWPVFVLVDGVRTGLDGVGLLAVRLALTAALTIASYALVEQPVRLGKVLAADRVLAPSILAVAAALVVVAVAVVPSQRSPADDLLAAGEGGIVEFPSEQGRPVARPVVGDDGGDDRSGDVLPPSPGAAPLAAHRPPARVVVVGTDPAPVVRLQRAGYLVVDGTRADCPLSRPARDPCPEPADLVAELVAEHAPDVVLVTTGIVESHDALDQRIAAQTDDELNALGVAEETAISETIAAIAAGRADGATVMWYTAAQTVSAYYRQFQRVAVMDAEVVTVHGPVHVLDHAVAEVLSNRARTSANEPLRVLVAGDSTSLYLAQALSDGSDGRLTVLWAGANGCPIAAVAATRGGSRVPWLEISCPSWADKLTQVGSEFAPDVVVFMSGAMELNEHRYADGAFAHAGEPRFAAARDESMTSLVGALGPQLPLLLVDMPALLSGRFTSADMQSPERLAAANAQLAEWAARWPSVAVFDYRSTLEGREAERGRLRADGIHPDVIPLEEMAREVYVDRLIEQVAAVRDEIARDPTAIADPSSG